MLQTNQTSVNGFSLVSFALGGLARYPNSCSFNWITFNSSEILSAKTNKKVVLGISLSFSCNCEGCDRFVWFGYSAFLLPNRPVRFFNFKHWATKSSSQYGSVYSVPVSISTLVCCLFRLYLGLKKNGLIARKQGKQNIGLLWAEKTHCKS